MSVKKQEDSYKVIFGFLISIIYFCLMILLTKVVYQDCLYYESFVYGCTLLVNIPIIFGFVLFVKKESLKKIKRKVLATIIVVLILCYPIIFLKCGTIANDTSIQKKNIFGKTTQALYYKDIESIEISIRHGIQYDIDFMSGDNVLLTSDELIIVNNFTSDENMMKFDKIISQYAKKHVWKDEYLTKNNIKRFIDDNVTFEYFDNFFREYY